MDILALGTPGFLTRRGLLAIFGRAHALQDSDDHDGERGQSENDKQGYVRDGPPFEHWTDCAAYGARVRGWRMMP